MVHMTSNVYANTHLEIMIISRGNVRIQNAKDVMDLLLLGVVHVDLSSQTIRLFLKHIKRDWKVGNQSMSVYKC